MPAKKPKKPWNYISPLLGKGNNTPKQLPSQLVTDNDHWYLVPESKLVAFHSAAELVTDYSEQAFFDEFNKYRVEPDRLRILKWEEMD